jgi:hypothetical protein
MTQQDQFSSYHDDLLDGRYDCVDRIVLNGYYAVGHTPGGFRTWWRRLSRSDATLDREHLLRMAGRFSRRLHAWAEQHEVPVVHCRVGERKHLLAAKYLPTDPKFRGVFLILVAKAPGLVWDVKKSTTGALHLERKQPWPYVNHYHFHLIDPEWGHMTIKISGHPPFPVQVIANGHEWVERKARQLPISFEKEGNCFVGGSLQALDQLAETLCDQRTIGQLTKACDRWIYSSCLCFALDLEEQERSQFRYRYSCFQLEYSRNLLFIRGTVLDAVYQGMLDRTRRLLDVEKLRTIFGSKHRPHRRARDGARVARMMRVVDESSYDLTVFKIHFGRLTLKIYDKGARVLRIEAIAHNVKDLRCGRLVEKLSAMVTKLQQMVINFLDTLHAAHHSFLPDDEILDTLPQPTQRGKRRLAGVDLQKSRTRTVTEAILALAPQPGGFTTEDLAAKTRPLLPQGNRPYTARHAAYDLMKLRGKNLIERIGKTRRYRPRPDAICILAGLLILRDKVIKPVLAGAGKPRVGRPPKTIHPLDQHYQNLQLEMRRTFQTLNLAA